MEPAAPSPVAVSEVLPVSTARETSGDRAALLLSRVRPVSSAALREVLKELSASHLAPPGDQLDQNPLQYELPGGGMVSIQVSAAPASDLLERLDRLPWPAPERTAVRTHTAQLQLRIEESSLPLTERKRALTQLAAALLETTGAVGVHWPDADTLHRPSTFRALARRAHEALPVRLWVALRIERGATVRVHTNGMRALDRPELVITAPESGLAEAVTRCFEWAQRIVLEPTDTPPSAVYSSSDLLSIPL